MMTAVSALDTTPEEAKNSVRMMILQHEQDRLLPTPNGNQENESDEDDKYADGCKRFPAVREAGDPLDKEPAV